MVLTSILDLLRRVVEPNACTALSSSIGLYFCFYFTDQWLRIKQKCIYYNFCKLFKYIANYFKSITTLNIFNYCKWKQLPLGIKQFMLLVWICHQTTSTCPGYRTFPVNSLLNRIVKLFLVGIAYFTYSWFKISTCYRVFEIMPPRGRK